MKMLGYNRSKETCDDRHRLVRAGTVQFGTYHRFAGDEGVPKAKNVRDLIVWQKAHSLTLACYKVTGGFPKQEMYGLSSQMRRCAASVAANLAEGCGKRGNGEFQRYLNISAGSASELEYHF